MEEILDDLSGNLDQAARRGDVQAVNALLKQRQSESLTETVKLISRLQGELAEKQEERDQLLRKLGHLSTPVQNGLKDYAAALQQLEKCQRAMHELQAQQFFCDNGLHLLRDEIKELEQRIIQLTAQIGANA